MLAEKVEVHQKEAVKALYALQACAKFAADHSTITGGLSSEMNDAIEAIENFVQRLERVTQGLRRLESAT
jgi:hypothetical protein